MSGRWGRRASVVRGCNGHNLVETQNSNGSFQKGKAKKKKVNEGGVRCINERKELQNRGTTH